MVKFSPCRRRNRTVGRVTLSGQDFYTRSDWGTAEAFQEYATILKEWEARGKRQKPKGGYPKSDRLGDVLSHYLDSLGHQGRYQKNGAPTSTWRLLRPCFSSMTESFGDKTAKALSKADLSRYRDETERLVAKGTMLPATANRRLAHLKKFVAWAISRDLLPDVLGFAADHLEPIRDAEHRGVVAARTRTKRAVSMEDVLEVCWHTGEMLGTMLKVHRIIGCRPGELCSMSSCDIDTTQVEGWWKWTPRSHKTEHHGQPLVYWIPKAAQELLKPWMIRHPMWDLTPEAYAAKTVKACALAGVARFTPHELRHAVATERANDPAIGLPAASQSLGHRRLSSLQPYVHPNEERIRAASERF